MLLRLAGLQAIVHAASVFKEGSVRALILGLGTRKKGKGNHKHSVYVKHLCYGFLIASELFKRSFRSYVRSDAQQPD